jgi:hypothetical protein
MRNAIPQPDLLIETSRGKSSCRDLDLTQRYALRDQEERSSAGANDRDGDPSPAPASAGALRRLVAEVHDGLRHGFFEFRLTCEVVGNERRRLTLHAGKSHQFVIRMEDCAQSLDSCDGSDPGSAMTRRAASST